jgi:uncharacterized protein YndB with AHSA1/START domain
VSEASSRTAGPGRQFTITRVFDAPRDLVFQAWTDPAHVTCWWGPRGFTTPAHTITMDVRPGGAWRACMVSDADGTEYPTGGVYREVVEPERLVFTWGDPDNPDVAGEASIVTVTFADLGDKTEMTFHQAGFPTDEGRANVQDGWTTCIERLTEYLAPGGPATRQRTGD